MELKNRFDRILNYIYSINNVKNDYSSNELLEDDDGLSGFMTHQGKIAASYMLNDEFSLENISLQNSIIKKDRKTDYPEDNIYDVVARIMVKNDTGYFTKKEYNLIALAHFTIGVDNHLKNHAMLFDYPQNI